MGHALCLQEWTNITGVANQVVTQHNTHWADVAGYDMMGVYLEISQCSPQGASTTTLTIQSAPDADEDIFNFIPVGVGITTGPNLVTYTLTATPSLGLRPIAIVPRSQLSRYVRWKLAFGTTATSIHFRIWLNLNQAGW
jgi:hypothetical protein